MKEIHAYRNEDGTYSVKGICQVMENGKLVDAVFEMTRARLDIKPYADESKRIFSVTVKQKEN